MNYSPLIRYGALTCLFLIFSGMVLIPHRVGATECFKREISDKMRDAWQADRLVLLVRHSEKCSSTHLCTQGDLGLTPKGFDQARAIRDGVQLLGG